MELANAQYSLCLWPCVLALVQAQAIAASHLSCASGWLRREVLGSCRCLLSVTNTIGLSIGRCFRQYVICNAVWQGAYQHVHGRIGSRLPNKSRLFSTCGWCVSCLLFCG